jgi:hypothetical protein
MIRAFRVLAFASIAWLGFGQSKETIFPASRAQALADVIGGFNAIGPRASILRRAMKPEDALAFDAVLEDVMGALMAIPGIGPRDPLTPGRTVAKCRPDRVGQLIPDLNAMERFFGRLSRSSTIPAEQRMFRRAQHATTRMLASLPKVLPTLDTRTLAKL